MSLPHACDAASSRYSAPSLKAGTAPGAAALPPPRPAGAAPAASPGGSPDWRPLYTAWSGATPALPARQPGLRGQRSCHPPRPQPLSSVLLAHQAWPGRSRCCCPWPARAIKSDSWVRRASCCDAASDALHLLQVSGRGRGSSVQTNEPLCCSSAVSVGTLYPTLQPISRDLQLPPSSTPFPLLQHRGGTGRALFRAGLGPHAARGRPAGPATGAGRGAAVRQRH